jgi:hypothetical protein
MRHARAHSFSFVGFTSTIKLPTTLPRRIIEIVVSMFSTSLVAVPALSRVDPVIASGPVRKKSGM